MPLRKRPQVQEMLRKIAPAISALLLILAYPRFDLEFIAWGALVPLFFALENKNTKQRFFAGYVFGLVFFSGILYWLINVSWPGAIILVLVLAFFPAIFSLFCRSLFALRLSSFAFIPAAWVFTEYLRSHILTGFPWALLGYSQCFTQSIIQIADITGPYGVSFLIVLVNLGIYRALRKTRGRFSSLFFILIIIAIVITYGESRINSRYPAQDIKVAVIQGNISQNAKWDPLYRKAILDKYASLTEKAFKENPGLIVWPETSVPGYLEDESDLEYRVKSLAESGRTHFLVGTLREDGDRTYNSATFISDKGEILESYGKIHLVPFGEFIPFEWLSSRLRNIVNKPIGDFDRGKKFTVFKFRVSQRLTDTQAIQKTTKFHAFSSLICFEDIFPDLTRKFVKNGARFLVNITNDAWFGKTTAPYQHMQGSIFRAVENRVPVLRAANTGVSCIIDHTGKVVKYVEKEGDKTFVSGYATAIIRPICSTTFYTRFGDVFSWLCIVLVCIGLGRSRLVLAAMLVLTLTGCAAAPGEKFDYENVLITRVIDGDTVELADGERVRLIGIDTPETWHSPKLRRDAKRTNKDARTIARMGELASSFARDLAENKRVRLEFDVEKRDRYGRLLAYVYLPDGRMLNAELLKEGYAQVYTFPPNVKYVDNFRELQTRARESSRGFWD